MSDVVLSVTEAARNFADCVNRAHYQHQSFLLMKNGVPVARIVPAETTGCSGPVLAEALASVGLSEADARAWQRDIKAGRKVLKTPVDRWK
jgi:prevent-host-death family protein